MLLYQVLFFAETLRDNALKLCLSCVLFHRFADSVFVSQSCLGPVSAFLLNCEYLDTRGFDLRCYCRFNLV